MADKFTDCAEKLKWAKVTKVKKWPISYLVVNGEWSCFAKAMQDKILV